MDRIPEGIDIRPTYENIIAVCPSCRRENIFNRVSDLKDLLPIDNKHVNCSECSKEFLLLGDYISPAYEMMIWDCYELIQRKHYAYCILNLAQACEVFFSHYLLVELLYRPLAAELDIQRMNRLSELLYTKIEDHPFERMRNVFFWLVLRPRHPASLDEAEQMIQALPDKPGPPSDNAPGRAPNVSNPHVSELLLRLKKWDIGKSRNKVVHKTGYRPTLEEVNRALAQAREILFSLGTALGVSSDDVNWYVRQGSAVARS